MSTPLSTFEDVPAPEGGPGGTGAPNRRDVKESGPEGRWDDRPLLAGALRVLSFLLPLVASLTAAWLLARALPTPTSTGGRIMWWLAVAVVSVLALLAFDRLARRLLPLAALLKLSMVFPDRAPSRLGVALRSGSTKRLQEQAVHDLQEGKQEPAAAARTILTLAASLNAHDRGTRGHSERVRAYADLIAEEIGLGSFERDRLRWAALLHDLGKLSVPSTTLNAHEALTEDDWATLRRHPLEGARLAAPLRDWLGTWATAIEQHHERFDGTGYPYGLSGEQLSLAARIVAVADSYDAMTSVRSYSAGITPAAARRELARKAGTDFDPAVVRAFLNVGLGRVRWVMGPLAFFSVVPFAPGLGSLRSAVTNTGRTVAMGTASLVAATAVVAPQLDLPAPEPRVLSEGTVRSAPRSIRAVPNVAPEAPLPEPVPETVEAETFGPVPATDASPVEPKAASAPASAAPVPTPAPSRTATVPAQSPPAPAAAPAPAPASSPPPPPTPAPATDDPPPTCPNAGKANENAPECAPQWGHTDERPPQANGKGPRQLPERAD
ncbi:MAG TPA: HD-GYP domain-containing protein [Acidimicrobiales bacterium]|nr:HD-GYP domain-containing protein [Acidimicrobiales bacterium]